MINVGEIFLLCIGVDKYTHLQNANLKYCENDARLIFDGYSSYPCQMSEIVCNSEANSTNIKKKLEDIRANARSSDYVIIYFAGHGVSTEFDITKIKSTNSYLLTSDSELAYLDDTAIKISDLKNKIELFKTANVTLILDCCQSGGAIRKRMASDNHLNSLTSRELENSLAMSRGGAVITSCDADEVAYEDDDSKHGYFTYYLYDTLKQTEDDLTPATKIIEITSKKMNNILTTKGLSQHPQIKCGRPEFVIPRIPTKPHNKKAIRINLEPVPQSNMSSIENLQEYRNSLSEGLHSLTFIDREFQAKYSSAYKAISDLIQPPHNSENVLQIYEESRQLFLPLIHILGDAMKYSPNDAEKIITNNVQLLLDFESISKRMSGTAAIIDIPITLVSEAIFKLLPIAFSYRHYDCIKLFLTEYYFESQGLIIPPIFNSKVWYPEIFHQDVIKYFEFLFNNKRKGIAKLEFNKTLELLYVFDAIAEINHNHCTYPISYIFDQNITPAIVSKLYNNSYRKALADILNLNEERLLQLLLERHRQIVAEGTMRLDNRLIIIYDYLKFYHELMKHLGFNTPSQTSGAS